MGPVSHLHRVSTPQTSDTTDEGKLKQKITKITCENKIEFQVFRLLLRSFTFFSHSMSPIKFPSTRSDDILKFRFSVKCRICWHFSVESFPRNLRSTAVYHMETFFPTLWGVEAKRKFEKMRCSCRCCAVGDGKKLLRLNRRRSCKLRRTQSWQIIFGMFTRTFRNIHF